VGIGVCSLMVAHIYSKLADLDDQWV
jgi:hypothetical protein